MFESECGRGIFEGRRESLRIQTKKEERNERKRRNIKERRGESLKEKEEEESDKPCNRRKRRL